MKKLILLIIATLCMLNINLFAQITFTENIVSDTASAAYSVFAIDVDGDGDIDMLSASNNDDKIAWYENDGNETFTEHIISTNADLARSVFAIDVDSDGDIDVLSASFTDNKIAWYENNGSQVFTEHIISTNADWANSVFAIDVDIDGDIDVLSASGNNDKIAWYENNGSEVFTEHIISTNADWVVSVFAIDVDSDGDVDVLSASINGNKIAWYRNQHPCLVANYPFNGNANDESGYGNDGTVNGATLTTDRFGNTDAAYDFDGVDDVIDLPFGSNIQGNNPRSIVAWYRLPNTINNYGYCIYKGGANGTGNDFTLWLNKIDSTRYHIHLRRYNSDVLSDTLVIEPYKWCQFAVTYDGTTNSNIKLYKDGQLTPFTVYGPGNTFNTPSVTPQIGNYIDQISNNFFAKGVLDDIQIFDCALDSAEIDSLYHIGGWNPCPGTPTVDDYDGNTYNTVQIGNQCWTKENMKTTHYESGTPIPNVTDNTAWSNLTTPAYCWFDNDSITYANTYGALYNWYTVETENMCPTGWHIPSDLEWTTLINYLGGVSYGFKLKEIGTTHWNSPNTSATNESGFTALPGGFRNDNSGLFYEIGDNGYWWSAKEASSFNAWSRRLDYDNGYVYRYNFNKINGFSIRCIKDEIDTCLGFNIDTLNIQDATCGFDNGYAQVIITGGNAPYTINWSNGDTLGITDTLSAGMHSIQVVDSLGCYAMEYFTVNSTGGPVITFNSLTDIVCNGENTGAIDISVTGGVQPYTIQWSNGANTEDLSNILAGNYQVMITDDNGCMASFDTIIVQPDLLQAAFTLTNPACLASDGEISVVVSGGVTNYNYNWSSGGTTNTITGLSAGTYSLTITDNNSCVLIDSVALTSTGGPVITLDSIHIAGCGGNDGAIYVSVTGGTTPYASYLWSDGTITEDLIDVNPNIYYLTVTDGAGCIAVFSHEIIGIEPLEQPICVVMVDSTTAMNLVVWEKVQTTGIEHYNIYRESWYAGQYDFIDAVMYDDMSEYVDPTANPTTRSWRYKISAEDACGNESPLSEHHKTIHLTINEGLGQTYNLIWDHYEGFPYFTYYIHRYMNATGWVLIDSLPANLTSYTDDPGTMGGLLYKISINTPNACIPTSTVKTNGGPYSHSVSNLEDNGIAVGIINKNTDMYAVIFPNPNTGEFTVYSNNSITGIEILNINGQLIEKIEPNKFNIKLNLSEQSKGIYIIKVTTQRGVAVEKVVLE